MAALEPTPLSSVLVASPTHFDEPLCALAHARDVLASCGGEKLYVRSADGERGGAGKPPGSIDSCACYPPASADDFAASQDDAAGGAAPARFTACLLYTSPSPRD